MLPAASTAMPRGVLKRAVEPFASVEPVEFASPATVDTTPPGVILRIVWLNVSATYRLPALSTATSSGWLNCAIVPAPSVDPGEEATPATVVTTPAAEILRTLCSDVSDTYRLPPASIVMPRGRPNRAALSEPSVFPNCRASPAYVDTKPVELIRRTTRLLLSATKILPAPSTTDFVGWRKRATEPTP